MTVFRDELTNLLHGDEDAKRLQSAELHAERVPARTSQGLPAAAAAAKGVVHGHCHHKSLLHFETEVDLLKKPGWSAMFRTPAAAAWPDRSATRQTITRLVSIAASAVLLAGGAASSA